MTLNLLYALWFTFFGAFNIRRDARDCAAMLNRVNYDGDCECSGAGGFGVDTQCDVTNEETICFGSNEEPQYCATVSEYRINSEERNRNRFSQVVIDVEIAKLRNDDKSWSMEFDHKSTSTTAIAYDSCIMEYTNATNFLSCNCSICESGVDFKYDCSAWVGPIRNGTCTSISSVLPRNPN